jgi:SNF2 family DNA or RNA helicase
MSFTHPAKRSSSSRVTYVPKPYQKECIKFGVSRPAAGFFLAPGLGKTSITLHIFKLLKKLDLVDEMVVLAKKRIVYDVWPDEIKKWEGLDYTARVLHGAKKQERIKRDADIWLINYDGLSWFVKQKAFFRRGKRMMLVCDESSKLKSSSTVRFRRLKKILKHFSRRYILTGSPVPNGLMGMFSQVFVLDLGKTFGQYITQFRNEYFHPSGYMGHDWQLNEGADKRMFKKLKPVIIRYGNDQLDLPPLSFVDRLVKLPPNARRRYEEMEQEFVTQLKNHEIVAANAAVASGKLRQIANGNIYLDPEFDERGRKLKKRKYLHIHDRKLDHLEELIDELNGEPAFVAYEFNHEAAELKKRFPKAVFLNSKTKDAEAATIKRDWNAGKIPLLFAHPDTAAHGLNMQGSGGIVIFFSLTWNLENYEQFIQRVWRQGQKRRVIVYRIIARGTVDEVMINALSRKDKTQQSLLKAMERHYGIAE